MRNVSVFSTVSRKKQCRIGCAHVFSSAGFAKVKQVRCSSHVTEYALQYIKSSNSCLERSGSSRREQTRTT